MELLLHTLELSTTRRDEIRDITREVASLIEKAGCNKEPHLFIVHTRQPASPLMKMQTQMSNMM